MTAFQPLHALSAAVDRLTAHADDWPTDRLLDEGLDLVRDASWADACALWHVDGESAVRVHSRPSAPSGSAWAGQTVPLSWFPWGLAQARPDRFLLVDDASALPVGPLGEARLGDLGVRSCLHLPLRERELTVGAIQVLWSEPRVAWDDDRGGLLRTLGRFLLTRARTGGTGG